MRRADGLGAKTAEITVAHVIGKDENDVRFRSCQSLATDERDERGDDETE